MADSTTGTGDPVLSLEAAGEGDDRVVTVLGEIDLHTAPDFERAVRDEMEAGRTSVVLDVSGVEFIDSSGLRSLIALQRDLRDGGGTLELRSPSRPVSRLLEVTGLTDLFGLSG